MSDISISGEHCQVPKTLWWSLTIAHKRMSMKTNNDEWVCCPVGLVVVAIYGSLLMNRAFYTILGCLSWYCYRISIYKLHIMLYSPQINYILPLIVCLKRLVLGFFFNLLTTLWVCIHAGMWACVHVCVCAHVYMHVQPWGLLWRWENNVQVLFLPFHHVRSGDLT